MCLYRLPLLRRGFKMGGGVKSNGVHAEISMQGNPAMPRTLEQAGKAERFTL